MKMRQDLVFNAQGECQLIEVTFWPIPTFVYPVTSAIASLYFFLPPFLAGALPRAASRFLASLASISLRLSASRSLRSSSSA